MEVTLEQLANNLFIFSRLYLSKGWCKHWTEQENLAFQQFMNDIRAATQPVRLTFVDYITDHERQLSKKLLAVLWRHIADNALGPITPADIDPRKRIEFAEVSNEQQARTIAERECQWRAWHLEEPVKITSGLFSYTVRDAMDRNGGDKVIRIRKRDGVVLSLKRKRGVR